MFWINFRTIILHRPAMLKWIGLLIFLSHISFPIAAQNQPGKIIFYRDGKSKGGNPVIYCDDQQLAQLSKGQYFEVTAPPGPHPCSAIRSLDSLIYLNVPSTGTLYQKVEVERGQENQAYLVFSNAFEFSQKGKLKNALSTPLPPLPEPQPMMSPPEPPGVFHAGKDGVSYPHCLSCSNPVYTERARRSKVEGIVVLRAVIMPDGTASDIQNLRKLGLGMDESAMDAVKRWRFEPARDANGVPVPVIVPIEVTFRLL